MPFSRFLRRAASSAAPLLLRGRPLPLSHPSRPLALLSPLPAAFSSSSFSSSSSSALQNPTSTTDAALLRVIDSEIKCAQDCDDHDRVEPVPEDFPFHIQDDQGMNIIRLTRRYQGKEDIEVTVSMPSLVTGEEPQEEEEHPEDEEEEEAAHSHTQSHVPLSVRVSKDQGLGPTLEFQCTAYPDEVVIDSMSVIESQQGEEGDDDLLAYEGPDFNDLDENLQKAFHKYLELRGITPCNTNFLHEYMINKDSREYLLWLRNLKAFVLK